MDKDPFKEYISIHKKLFTGIFNHVGKIRDYNIMKKEWVLDGATVLYESMIKRMQSYMSDKSPGGKNVIHHRCEEN